MKIVTLQREDEAPVMGWLVPGGVLNAGSLSNDAAFACVQSFIESGPDAWREGASLATHYVPENVIPSDKCKLLAPLPRPIQMRDFMAFEDHVSRSMRSIAKLQAMAAGEDAEAALTKAVAEGRCEPPQAWYEQPLYYKANRFAVSGPDEEIHWPTYSKLMDYECELACIIGKGGRDISTEAARDHIFGFTIWNDFSARDAQFAEVPGYLGPAKGKDFDGANAMGPCIVTLDEIGDYYDLNMAVAINGDPVSNGNSGSIHHSFEKMIERVSASETIYPGEVLGSGTVGNGCGLERLEFLQDGDEIALTIDKIGTLVNRVRAPGG